MPLNEVVRLNYALQVHKTLHALVAGKMGSENNIKQIPVNRYEIVDILF